MIDFHSHILPGIDDGSQSVEESLRLLEALRKQRVDTVVASSHYDASRYSPRHFLEKRAYVFRQLAKALPAERPEILLGAEVLYFPGLSRVAALRELCIEGTDVLLLEMPFGSWTEYMVREVLELARSGDFTVLLAHVERYLTRQNRPFWDRLLADGVLMQSNADFFLSFFTRGKALRMLESGYIHLLGTDCHNMTSRPPRMAEGRRAIRDKLGKRALREIDELGETLLEGAVGR